MWKSNSLALETREIMELPFHVQEIAVDEKGNIDEEPIDDDYNEIVKLVAQEEENQENDSALSAIKLPPKMQGRSP